MEVDHHLKGKGKNEFGMLIFDETKEHLGDVERSLRTLRLEPESILKTTNIVEKGFFVDSSKSFGLQLIDLSAYYIRKYEEHKMGIKVSELDKQTFVKIETLISTGIGSDVKDVLDWVRKYYIK
jgi:hypothetical protein